MLHSNNAIINVLKFIIYLYPISFIFGNLIINIFTLLTITLGLISFHKKILDFKDKKIIIIISLFFLILILSTLFQVLNNGYYPDSIKSLAYLRFFILLLIIKTMVSTGLLNLNYFLFSCLIFSGFVSLDILIQFIFGQNLLGNQPIIFSGDTKYFSGLFNKELIAGGYILMFSSLGIFGLPFIAKNLKKITLLFIFLISFLIFFSSLILAGNRMPTLMFIFFIILLSVIINKKQYKYHFLSFSFVILVAGFLAISQTENLKNRYLSFFVKSVPNPVKLVNELKKNYPELEQYKDSEKPFHALKQYNNENYKLHHFYSGHFSLYLTSIDLFLDDPIYGKGIKTYRNNCIKKVYLPNRVCESHPHNFILEILNDVGVLGLFFIIFPVSILIINLYREYLLGDRRLNDISNWVYIAIVLVLIIQFFPFKSSGSFFSTFNSTYTFLVLGISLGLNEIRFKNIKK